MKILIFGKNGQLGTALQEAFLNTPYTIISLGRDDANLEQPETLRPLIQQLRPDIIINAAAYTLVDQAEDEPERAHIINAIAPSIIAEEAHKIGAWLIHYSTDYVYDGTKTTPYTEADQTNPLSIYGKTKCEGDEGIAPKHNQYLILRTSWCYSTQGKNFAKTILNLAKTKDQMNIVSDQVGSPASSERIAIVTKEIVKQIAGGISPEVSGVYHLTASGETSWYEYARFLLQQASGYNIPFTLLPDNIHPIPSASYNAKATRPQNSRLNIDKIKTTFGIELPNWQEDVSLFVKSYCQSLLNQKDTSHDKS